MPFFWNDKTYWKRYRESHRIFVKVFLPMFVVNLLLWYSIIERELIMEHLVIGSISTTAVLFTFLNLFKHFPNAGIPDTYSPFGKKLMYIGQFLAACFGLYIIVTKVIFV